MDIKKLIQLLGRSLPSQLVCDLVENFLILRQDVATGVLGRSAPGKFVETFVQVLQFLEVGKFDAKPNVDEYLRTLESRSTSLDDGLRICAARIGRAMYALRSKRNILHKGHVDPNTYDLKLLHSAAQWVLAELIRSLSGGSMEEAGKLVEQIQVPVGGLVEDFGGRRIVLKDLLIAEEILVLMHSHYPETVTSVQIISSLYRRSPRSVRNTLRSLWKEKILEGNNKIGYLLTRRGFDKAIAIVSQCIENGTGV